MIQRLINERHQPTAPATRQGTGSYAFVLKSDWNAALAGGYA